MTNLTGECKLQTPPRVKYAIRTQRVSYREVRGLVNCKLRYRFPYMVPTSRAYRVFGLACARTQLSMSNRATIDFTAHELPAVESSSAVSAQVLINCFRGGIQYFTRLHFQPVHAANWSTRN